MSHPNLVRTWRDDPSKDKCEGKWGEGENRRAKVFWSNVEGLTTAETIEEGDERKKRK